MLSSSLSPFVLVLSFAFFFTTITAFRDPRTDTYDDTCDLRCWLSALEITLPDQQINATWLLHEYTGNITDLTCKGVDLGPIASTFSEATTGVSVALTGLGTSCYGDWSVLDHHGKNYDHSSGQGVASLFNSSLSLKLELFIDGNGFYQRANLSQCEAVIFMVANLTGGDLAETLNNVLNQSMPEIEHALSKFICSEITSLVNNNLTTLLGTISDTLSPYMVPSSPPILPYPSSDSMNLTSWLKQIAFLC